MTEIEMVFRKNIIYLRMVNKLTRYQVAKKADISLHYYYRIEELEKPINPTFDTLEKLAALYDINVADLFIPQY